MTPPPAWALGLREIARADDRRTSIAAILPGRAGFGHLPLLSFALAADRQPRQDAAAPTGPVQGELLLE